VTGDGEPVIATAPPAPAPDETIVVEVGPSLWRNVGKWSVGFLFSCTLLALLGSLCLYQLTAEGPSKRTLRRAVAALTEIDPLIDRNYDDLQQRAAAAGPDETLTLRDFPVQVQLTREEAQSLSKQELRDVLLDRSANVMYSHGTDALREPAASSGNVGVFSLAGITDNGLDFLRSRNHDILRVLTFALAVLAAVLGGLLVLLCRGFGRLASVGAAVLVAAIPIVLLGIGARFYMRIVSTSDTEYLQREFLSIGQGLAWIPIRDGLAFTVLGAALLAAGIGLAVWADRRGRPRYPAARPHAR